MDFGMVPRFLENVIHYFISHEVYSSLRFHSKKSMTNTEALEQCLKEMANFLPATPRVTIFDFCHQLGDRLSFELPSVCIDWDACDMEYSNWFQNPRRTWTGGS